MLKKNVLIASLLLIIAFLLTAFSYLNYWQTPIAATIIIEPQQRTKDISHQLSDKLFLPLPVMFSFLAKSYSFYYKSPLQAGEYAFPSGYRTVDIIKDLLAGNVVTHKITIPEGYTTHQILQALQKAPALIGDIDINSLQEGIFLPETYYYKYPTTRASILGKMQQAQLKFLNQYWPERQDNLWLSTKADILTLASIVEKEAKIAEEMPIIARVYLNRLKIGMPLQACPTVIYAATKGAKNDGVNISEQKSTLDSPYNSYMYKGLPPTPISNPGKMAILAVLNPASNNYLYFVSDGHTGKHLFANNYKQHLANIKLSNNNSHS